MALSNTFAETQKPAAGELIAAAKEGQLASAAALLKAGADINEKDEDGMTALMWAAKKGHESMAEMLIGEGAPLDEQEEGQRGGWTAIMFAAGCGRGCYEKTVRLLAEAGADLTRQNKEGETALHLAVGLGISPNIAAALAEYGAPLETRDSRNRTPLLRALDWDGNDEAAQQLVRDGASLDVVDLLGVPALALAVTDGKVETVRLMIEKGADIERPQHQGYTALRVLDSLLQIEGSEKHDNWVQIVDLLQRGPEIFQAAQEAAARESEAQEKKRLNAQHAATASRQRVLKSIAVKAKPS